jgi:hypothetical protein
VDNDRDTLVRSAVESITNYLIAHPEKISRILYSLVAVATMPMNDVKLLKYAQWAMKLEQGLVEP